MLLELALDSCAKPPLLLVDAHFQLVWLQQLLLLCFLACWTSSLLLASLHVHRHKLLDLQNLRCGCVDLASERVHRGLQIAHLLPQGLFPRVIALLRRYTGGALASGGNRRRASALRAGAHAHRCGLNVTQQRLHFHLYLRECRRCREGRASVWRSFHFELVRADKQSAVPPARSGVTCCDKWTAFVQTYFGRADDNRQALLRQRCSGVMLLWAKASANVRTSKEAITI